MIQLYGHWSNYLSAANVSRALAHAIRRENLTFSIWETGPFSAISYKDSPWDVGMSPAPVGIAFGYPPQILHWLQGHSFKIMVTVCEADRIPPPWVDCANAADLIVVPSEFCREAFAASGVKPTIAVVPHGVWFTANSDTPKRLRSRSGRLLHVAGAASFPDRKGTAKLLRAFAEVSRGRDLGELHVVWPKPQAIRDLAQELGCAKIVPIAAPPVGVPPKRMARILRSYDAVVNPSRAEGFGIIPLEARCLGVPAILTGGTGHDQHVVHDVDVIVDTGRVVPIHTQGNAVGSAPSVSTEAIARALRVFHDDRDAIEARTNAWARLHADDWRWMTVLKPFTRRLRELRHTLPGNLKLGATAGLGEG